jgi:cytochrome c oxidase subunit 2
MFADVPLFPEQASTHAEKVDALFFALLGVSGFFALLIAVLIIYFAIKYRRRSDADLPPRIEGGLKLEVFWSVVPLLISLGLFYWGAKVFFRLSTPPPNCMDVYVVGKQWMWKLQHVGGQREINQLHVPVNTPVKLTLISQDVIHDFAVPAFRIKQDVLPGRYTETWFEATRIGTYHLFCDQYCGTDHSGMVGKVVVLSRADFQKWLSRGAEADDSLAARGEKLFRKLQCITCHSSDSGARAPVLEGLYDRRVELRDGRRVTADARYIRRSILDPDADVVAGFDPIMPTFRGQVTDEELFQLIAYIKSIRDRRPGDRIPRTERTAPPAAIKEPRKK